MGLLTKNGSVRTEKVVKDNKTGLPAGAKILKKTVTTSVEEIENGFIITKSYDISYEKPEGDGETETGYTYYNKKWYTKEDPLTINIKEKSLADAFSED